MRDDEQIEEKKETREDLSNKSQYDENDSDEHSLNSKDDDLDGIFDLIVTMDIIKAPFKDEKSG